LKNGDKISVYQQNSDEHVLSKTDEYTFDDDELNPSSNESKNTQKKNKNSDSKKKAKS
jgi:hypothetical protein